VSRACETIEALVHAMSLAAQDVLVLDLRRADGGALPAFTAGAHVDLHLPGGLVRSYSLLNPLELPGRYCVAVHRHPAGRGGSRQVHDVLRVGQRIAISLPRNHFVLDDSAAQSLLVAGGIGITPLWAMVQRLEATGRPWRLHYAARSRAQAPLLEEIEAFAARARHGQASFHASRAGGARRLGLAGILAQAGDDAHLYCCGPAGMVDDFLALTRERRPEHVHVERFEAARPVATGGSFTVDLARCGRSLAVPAGRTLLSVLLEHGVPVAHSCEQGICGSCEVAVLEGEPDHQDSVLTEREKQAGRTMMVCCSRARSPSLVLEL
jgi:vanillate O-demethylase ferredoxin subunit